MQTLKELQLKVNGENKVICFGIPDNPNEIEEMHKLRYNVYSSRNYIDPKRFPDGIEKDQYDINKKCVYFIAKIDNKIIGTIRLIKDYFLPTEKECFKFEEPEDIKKIQRENRAELGRLIVIPYNDTNNATFYIPRNLITLFLINCLVEYGLQNNIHGGYAFIKNDFRVKLEKLKIPIHLIKQYTQIYPRNGILYGYFNQSNNKVIPMYFITLEFKQYIDKVINRYIMFKKINKKRYILKENLYNKFLKFLKII
jgi:N-acyl-L-homoserine lactone synthetase